MRIVEPAVGVMLPNGINPVLEHLERCGRVCYKSEDKITDGSAETFVANLVKRGHLAVTEHYRFIIRVPKRCYRALQRANPYFLRLTEFHNRYIVSGSSRGFIELYQQEHCPKMTKRWLRKIIAYLVDTYNCGILFPIDIPKASEVSGISRISPKDLTYNERKVHQWYTLRIICDRGVSHEIVRHRAASYCQESTRYCNYSKEKFGFGGTGDVSFIRPTTFTPGTSAYQMWETLCQTAQNVYFNILNFGCSPQEARSVLPNSLKTEVVMTATVEEWLHFLELRDSPAAHPDMVVVAKKVREILAYECPKFFYEEANE